MVGNNIIPLHLLEKCPFFSAKLTFGEEGEGFGNNISCI